MNKKKIYVTLERFLIVILTQSIITVLLSQINIWASIAYAILILSLSIHIAYENSPDKSQRPKPASPTPHEKNMNDLEKENKELSKKLWDNHVRYVKLKLEHEILQKLIDDITKKQTDR